MSKELKNFIDQNRRAFDDEMPADQAWNRIEKSIIEKKKAKQLPVRRIYQWAAAAAIFFIAGTGFYYLLTQKKTSRPGATSTEVVVKENDISHLAPEYAAEANKIYLSIEKRQEELRAMAKKQPNLYHQFAEDLSTLDSSYRVLKTQAMQAPNREIIIKAMMQNLQLQSELLGKQLRIINELNNPKINNNEKNSYRPA